MKHLILLLLFCTSISYSQNTDYNTKKGFIANGYDVVAYFNNEAKAGNKLFVSEFDGIRFKFSSKENLDSFNKNPKKYIPEYGGYCAYAVALKSSKVSINPETFKIEDGKLYLFYNAWGTNTLELWQKENPTLLKQKADKNWELIK
ncbi:MAG: YHS domain-containing (seleno)protein [Algibacter sp.]